MSVGSRSWTSVLLFAAVARRLLPTWTKSAWVAALAFALLLCSAASFALDVPALQGRVNDHAGLLTAAEAQQLEQKLAAYEQKSGRQFALLTVPSLQADGLEDFSMRVVEQWQLGQEQTDDGLLLLIAAKDRRMRIEVGYGLEGNIPDALAGRVIRNVLAPAFREQHYAQGIDQAFTALMKAAGGEAVELPRPAKRGTVPFIKVFPVLFLGLFLLLSLIGARRRGFVWFGGFGGGGGHYGGGGGLGGGFSGGGGGFGGGGASGGW